MTQPHTDGEFAVLPTEEASSPAEQWLAVPADERLGTFQALPRTEAAEVFQALDPSEQVILLHELPVQERRIWLRLLPLDAMADVVQHANNDDERVALLDLLDSVTRVEVQALLAYADDEAGGKMNPRYARLRPEMTVEQAIFYVRHQTGRQIDLIYYLYIVDDHDHLVGVISFRDLLTSRPQARIAEIMRRDFTAVHEDDDQETVARVLQNAGLLAIPVVDDAGRMKGMITADDVLDVLQDEATEDIQKLGGVNALDLPYSRTPVLTLVQKRAGWLSILFVGEMLTATAIGFFEHELERAVILALFLPMIISSGGNTGSQAATLMVRALAIGEVRLGDWARVMRREFVTGALLGLILAVIGIGRILTWHFAFGSYPDHAYELAATIGISLMGVVLWGSLVGGMLPFALRRLGFDPATASAPFVATLSDVTGLVIYFGVAKFILIPAL
ncbi:MAG: magnesium transporter [Chloroflexi bacterium]|nr:MAG: magnesium transporter [Chloroflexota bacterium]